MVTFNFTLILKDVIFLPLLIKNFLLMKSILQTLFGKLSKSFAKASSTSSKNSLSTSSTLFEKSGNNDFLVAYLSTLMYSIFGFALSAPGFKLSDG